MEHLSKMSNIRDKVIERVINKIKSRSNMALHYTMMNKHLKLG